MPRASKISSRPLQFTEFAQKHLEDGLNLIYTDSLILLTPDLADLEADSTKQTPGAYPSGYRPSNVPDVLLVSLLT